MEVATPMAALDDLQAGIDASIQVASDDIVFDNAQVSNAVLRTLEPNSITVAVTVMEFSQDGSWFVRALSESPELESIRRPPSPLRWRVYIQPTELFEMVVEHLRAHNWDLKPRHVVVLSEDVERVKEVIERAVEATPRRQRGGSGCSVKSQMQVFVPVPDLSGVIVEDPMEDPPISAISYIVKETMVHVKIPSSMYSELSVRGATV